MTDYSEKYRKKQQAEVKAQKKLDRSGEKLSAYLNKAYGVRDEHVEWSELDLIDLAKLLKDIDDEI